MEMKVLLASPRGFCAGVDRAIEIVERALDLYGAPVYVLHEIVHNRHVIGGLRARGVTLKLRYSNYKTLTRSRTLDRAVHEDHVILATVVGLFRPLFTPRTRVRLVGVGLTSLTAESAPTEQMELFQHRTDKPWGRLYRGIDRLRKKYGFRSILRGSSFFN